MDRAGVPALPVSQSSQQQVWRAQNTDGSYTVALFNLGTTATNIQAGWSDLGFDGSATVRDVWSHTDLGSFGTSYSRSVPAHGSALVRVTPATGSRPLGGSLISALSDRCVDVPNATATNGSQLTVYDCNGGINQRVTYRATNKTLMVQGKCFDAHANGTTPGTHVEIYDCTGGTNQQWNVNPDGSITGVGSGTCLDVTGTANPNGAGLELWTCNGGGNQRWLLGAGARVI